MKRFIPTFLLFAVFCIGMQAQVLVEDFETPSLPVDWTQTTNATDGGWQLGTASSLSSQFWEIRDNGSGIIATNDDACNCDKSEDRLITPAFMIADQVTVVLEFDVYFGEGFYAGTSESGSVDISTDGGQTWTVLQELSGSNDWERVFIDLTEYANTSVQIGFTYRDNGGWLFGMALDNIAVRNASIRDVALSDLAIRSFAEEGEVIAVRGELLNKAGDDVESIELNYSINGGTPLTEIISDLQIPAFSAGEFEHPVPWVPDTEGDYIIEVWVSSVNDGPDSDESNNSIEAEVEVFAKIEIPNKIDEFLNTDPEFRMIGDAADQLDLPTDLDFFPILGKRELWVINERVENSGGSTVTYFDAGTPEQTSWQRVDGNAWHFMSLPTALEFSTENFNFASAPGVFDANHNGGDPFTGPSLWSSDPEIYAQPSGGNGSHLDMLHGSPHSMGIAHEVDNVFWIFDGYHEELVRYDFVDDHGPGNSYHGDAIVRRYTEIELTRDAPVPSHMILDKDSGWMYIVDNGTDRVLRVNINSGQIAGALALINEPLAEHSEVLNVEWEVIVDSGLDRPCGIDIIENRMIVGDYATGQIIVYDMENGFEELGRIETGAAGLTGLKIGPDGNIWFTNRLENTVQMIEPGIVSSVNEPAVSFSFTAGPIPTRNILEWQLGQVTGNQTVQIALHDAMGRELERIESSDRHGVINLSKFASGVYTMQVQIGNERLTKRVVVAR